MTLLLMWAVVAVVALVALGVYLGGWGMYERQPLKDGQLMALVVAAVLWPIALPLFLGTMGGMLLERRHRRRAGQSPRRPWWGRDAG